MDGISVELLSGTKKGRVGDIVTLPSNVAVEEIEAERAVYAGTYTIQSPQQASTATTLYVNNGPTRMVLVDIYVAITIPDPSGSMSGSISWNDGTANRSVGLNVDTSSARSVLYLSVPLLVAQNQAIDLSLTNNSGASYVCAFEAR